MSTNNPFEKIIKEEKEVPESLKKRVMDDAANAKLILDFAELFTSSIPQSIYQSIVDKRNNSDNPQK